MKHGVIQPETVLQDPPFIGHSLCTNCDDSGLFVLEAVDFVARGYGYTLFHPLHKSKEIELVRSGTGKGAFVVVMAKRSNGVPVQEKPPKQCLGRVDVAI